MKKTLSLCLLIVFIFAAEQKPEIPKHVLSLNAGDVGGLFTFDYQYTIWSDDNNNALRADAALGGCAFVNGARAGVNYVRGDRDQLLAGCHFQYSIIADFDDEYEGEWIYRQAVVPLIGYAHIFNWGDVKQGFHIYFLPQWFLDTSSIVPWGGIGLEIHL